MANLKEVKERISSVNSTKQMTNAMKMVAAAKMRKAQDMITQLRPYAAKLDTLLSNLAQGLGDVEVAYAEQRPVKKVLIVAITSDRGLCGGFNSNIHKELTQAIKDLASYDVEVMPIGKKVADFTRRHGLKTVTDYADFFQNVSFDNAKDGANYAMDSFVEAKYDKVFLIYNEFKNPAVQIVRREQFLPIVPAEDAELEASGNDTQYIIEPDPEFVVKELIPKSLRLQFYKALLESNAGEQGARMTAMSQATDNADELLKDLKLTYNRTRQAAITTEILEIVGGAEALAAGR